jgi:hypothetical protein
VGDVVRPDDDHGDVDGRRSARATCTSRSADLAPDDGDDVEVDAAAQVARHARRR